jgi:hypothetical protein
LCPDGERGEDQHVPAGAISYKARPLELHRRLPESALREDRRPTLPGGELHDLALKVVQAVAPDHRVEAGVVRPSALAPQELLVPRRERSDRHAASFGRSQAVCHRRAHPFSQSVSAWNAGPLNGTGRPHTAHRNPAYPAFDISLPFATRGFPTTVG